MNADAPAPAAPKKRWPTRIFWTLGAAALLWFAPAIIANSPWRDYAINLALGKIEGRVTTTSASLGWLSPVKISGLRIDNFEGKPMLDVAEIRTSQSLLSFLIDRSRLGEIRLQKPSVHLTLSDQSSNLEDALAPLLKTSAGGDGSTDPSLTLAIEGGTVTMEDEITGKSWELHDFSADLNSQPQTAAKMLFHAKGMLNSPGGPPATFSSEGQLNPSQDGQGEGEVKLTAEQLPLDALTPWLRRMTDPIRIEGALSGTAVYDWETNGLHAVTLKQVAAETLTISAPKQLGPSRVILSKLAAQGKIAIDSDRIAFDGFTLDSTAAKVEATGGADWRVLSQGDLAHIGEFLRDEDLNFKAYLDIAEAARAFPEVLRIRRGTEITSGKLVVQLDSSTKSRQRRWTGGVKADSLAAAHEGKSVVWEKPVDLDFEAHKAADGVVIDRLNCASSFLKASGSADPQEGRFDVEADLSALYSELSRFADLSDLQLRGKLNSRIDWQRAGEEAVQVAVDARVADFELRIPDHSPWTENHLTVQSTAKFKLAGSEIVETSSGELSLLSAKDKLNLVLLSPVASPFAAASWPVRVETSGALETWKPRLQHFAPLRDWELAGQFDVKAEGKVSSQKIEWQTASGKGTNLKAFGPAIYIQESTLNLLESQGSLDLQTGDADIDALSALGADVSLYADKFKIRFNNGALLLAGRLDYEAKLEALQAWTHHPRIPSDYLFGGKAKGSIVAETGASSAQLDYSMEIVPLTIAQNLDGRSASRADLASTKNTAKNAAKNAPQAASNLLWREPTLRSLGHVEYDLASGQVRLEEVKLQGDTLSASLTGTIDDFTTKCVAALSGEIEYDADKLSPLLAASSGLDLQISGKRKEQYALRGPLTPMIQSLAADFAIPVVMQPISNSSAPPRGPMVATSLWPRDLQADLSAGWAKATIAGIATGPVEVDGKLRDGAMRISPLDVRLSAGAMRLEPILDFSTRPYLARFAPGPMIDRAAITPQLCRSWLKYVNPMMADVTEVEGEFSLELGESAFPLAQPLLGQANGALSLHQAQVGPGPLSRELIEIGKQVEAILKSRPPGNVRTWLTMPEQQVRFAVQGGRVFHEQLVFQVRDVSITTRGSVGLDQSLQLLAEVPIKDEWIAKEKMLSGLKGQSLQIPIGGTLSQPKVDSRAVAEIGARLVDGAVRGKLNEEIEKGLQKGLDKLLRPKK